MEDAMNKCTASAFQSSEIVHCLKFLRDAYCSERISAAHKAVVKADLNRAIDSVLHANAEFCQGGSGGRTATYKKRWMSIEIIEGIMEFQYSSIASCKLLFFLPNPPGRIQRWRAVQNQSLCSDQPQQQLYARRLAVQNSRHLEGSSGSARFLRIERRRQCICSLHPPFTLGVFSFQRFTGFGVYLARVCRSYSFWVR